MEETGLSGVASDMSVDSLKNFIVGMEVDWLKEIFSFSTLYQFVAIAAAVGIALFVHRRFGAMLHAMAISFANRGEAWLMRVWVFLLDLGRAVLFSFTAAVLLSLCVMLLQTTGLVGEGARLVFVRLSYQIFYAWATIFAPRLLNGTKTLRGSWISRSSCLMCPTTPTAITKRAK